MWLRASEISFALQCLVETMSEGRDVMFTSEYEANQTVTLRLLIDRGVTKELRQVRCKAGNIERVKRKHDKTQARVVGHEVLIA